MRKVERTKTSRVAARRSAVKAAARKALIASKVDAIVAEIVDEAEDILEDTECVVKECTPSRKVKTSMKSVAASLKDEGIRARFDDKVTRTQLRKTADLDVTEDELKEGLQEIVNTAVEVFEDMAEGAEAKIDEAIAEVADQLDVTPEAIDDEVKTEVESKLFDEGLRVRFARKVKRMPKRTARSMGRSAKRENPILKKLRG